MITNPHLIFTDTLDDHLEITPHQPRHHHIFLHQTGTEATTLNPRFRPNTKTFNPSVASFPCYNQYPPPLSSPKTPESHDFAVMIAMVCYSPPGVASSTPTFSLAAEQQEQQQQQEQDSKGVSSRVAW